MTADRTPVAGSERPPLAGARRVGDPDPDKRAEVTLTLRRRGGEDPQGAVDRAQFAERYGADPEDIRRIEDFAADHDLDVVQADPARRTVVLRGRLADLSAAFGAELGLYEHPELGTFRGRVGTMSVPSGVAGAVESVLGLDDRPAAFPHFRPAAAHATPTGFTPPAAGHALRLPGRHRRPGRRWRSSSWAAATAPPTSRLLAGLGIARRRRSRPSASTARATTRRAIPTAPTAR